MPSRKRKKKSDSPLESPSPAGPTTILPECGPAEIIDCTFSAVHGSQYNTTNHNNQTHENLPVHNDVQYNFNFALNFSITLTKECHSMMMCVS
ncbi:hypothetical protein BT96DRAFT_998410 [Gymnopus androsaceus JB14]|uniref:Uncharacterized protein n=1 Tax=Gymnopus androsaceus JB14 TaxID=1447944 RepID=A0A6A4HA37_9AGAR|nr:hypothetical protein BT96DRAFT_998410 [Gymnopus androsaceus JB14]